MCGFFGVIDRSGAKIVCEGLESRIRRTLLQRGPDVCKSTQGDGLYLAHSRLSITDASSAADQPLVDDTGSVYLLFNGEIYNYKELRRQYLRDDKFQTTSDTEVILRLYQRLGRAALDVLDGMFVLAIVDLHRRTLLLARDAVGKKPLFHSIRGETIMFSSDTSLIAAYSRAN